MNNFITYCSVIFAGESYRERKKQKRKERKLNIKADNYNDQHQEEELQTTSQVESKGEEELQKQVTELQVESKGSNCWTKLRERRKAKALENKSISSNESTIPPNQELFKQKYGSLSKNYLAKRKRDTSENFGDEVIELSPKRRKVDSLNDRNPSESSFGRFASESHYPPLLNLDPSLSSGNSPTLLNLESSFSPENSINNSVKSKRLQLKDCDKNIPDSKSKRRKVTFSDYDSSGSSVGPSTLDHCLQLYNSLSDSSSVGSVNLSNPVCEHSSQEIPNSENKRKKAVSFSESIPAVLPVSTPKLDNSYNSKSDFTPANSRKDNLTCTNSSSNSLEVSLKNKEEVLSAKTKKLLSSKTNAKAHNVPSSSVDRNRPLNDSSSNSSSEDSNDDSLEIVYEDKTNPGSEITANVRKSNYIPNPNNSVDFVDAGNQSEPPVSSKKGPMNSEEVPVNSNKPVNSKKAPVTSNKPAVNSKKPLVNSNRPPVNSKKGPRNSKEVPVNSKKAPVTSNKPSVNSNKPFVNSNKAPVNSKIGLVTYSSSDSDLISNSSSEDSATESDVHSRTLVAEEPICSRILKGLTKYNDSLRSQYSNVPTKKTSDSAYCGNSEVYNDHNKEIESTSTLNAGDIKKVQNDSKCQIFSYDKSSLPQVCLLNSSDSSSGNSNKANKNVLSSSEMSSFSSNESTNSGSKSILKDAQMSSFSSNESTNGGSKSILKDTGKEVPFYLEKKTVDSSQSANTDVANRLRSNKLTSSTSSSIHNSALDERDFSDSTITEKRISSQPIRTNKDRMNIATSSVKSWSNHNSSFNVVDCSDSTITEERIFSQPTSTNLANKERNNKSSSSEKSLSSHNSSINNGDGDSTTTDEFVTALELDYSFV